MSSWALGQSYAGDRELGEMIEAEMVSSIQARNSTFNQEIEHSVQERRLGRGGDMIFDYENHSDFFKNSTKKIVHAFMFETP